MLVFDTICGATKERQSDLVSLVEQGAEAIVVIGGSTRPTPRNWPSSRRPTSVRLFTETAEDLDAESFSSFALVGVTAGASTPEFIIRSVCERLESF